MLQNLASHLMRGYFFMQQKIALRAYFLVLAGDEGYEQCAVVAKATGH
jgi:hypothetical protein